MTKGIMEVRFHLRKKDFKEIGHLKDHFQGQYKFNQPLIKNQRGEFKWNNLKILIYLTILELCKVYHLLVEAMCKFSFLIEYLFWFFKVQPPEENNNKYSKFDTSKLMTYQGFTVLKLELGFWEQI